MNHPPRSTEDGRQVFWAAATTAFRPHAGWAFYGAGALLVLLGYLGISDEAIVAKQLPFLISGGIGGILLALLGLYVLSMDRLREDGERLRRLERQVDELHQALLARPGAPAIGPASDAPGSGRSPSRRDVVFVVEAGESFHRQDCRLVLGKDETELGLGEASARGLRPCPVCQPVAVAS